MPNFYIACYITDDEGTHVSVFKQSAKNIGLAEWQVLSGFNGLVEIIESFHEDEYYDGPEIPNTLKPNELAEKYKIKNEYYLKENFDGSLTIVFKDKNSDYE